MLHIALYEPEIPPNTRITSYNVCYTKLLRAVAEKQDDTQATYAHKLSKDEARIDWSQPAAFIERCVRAFNPWPVSYFELDGMNIKVWSSEVIDIETQKAPGTIVDATKSGLDVMTGQGVLRIIV